MTDTDPTCTCVADLGGVWTTRADCPTHRQAGEQPSEALQHLRAIASGVYFARRGQVNYAAMDAVVDEVLDRPDLYAAAKGWDQRTEYSVFGPDGHEWAEFDDAPTHARNVYREKWQEADQ